MLVYMNDYKPANCLQCGGDHCDNGPAKQFRSSKYSRCNRIWEDGVNTEPANNWGYKNVKEKRLLPATNIKTLTQRMFTPFSHYSTTETSSIRAALKGQT